MNCNYKCLLIFILITIIQCQLQLLNIYTNINRNYNKIIVLVFVDKRSIGLLINWLLVSKEIINESKDQIILSIYCIDNISKYKLLNCGIICIDYNEYDYNNTPFNTNSNINKNIWMKRFDIVRLYLLNGFEVIVCDSDAFWIKSPIDDIKSLYRNQSDIVVSRASWPKYYSEIWGATACLGFIYIKPTNFSIELINELLYRMYNEINKLSEVRLVHVLNTNLSDASDKLRGDDQIIFNDILYDYNITWITNTNRLEFPNNNIVNYGYINTSNHLNVITLLPHYQYRRRCLDTNKFRNYTWFNNNYIHELKDIHSDSVVLHCVTHRNIKQRRLQLQYHRLLKVRIDWDLVINEIYINKSLSINSMNYLPTLLTINKNYQIDALIENENRIFQLNLLTIFSDNFQLFNILNYMKNKTSYLPRNSNKTLAYY